MANDDEKFDASNQSFEEAANRLAGGNSGVDSVLSAAPLPRPVRRGPAPANDSVPPPPPGPDEMHAAPSPEAVSQNSPGRYLPSSDDVRASLRGMAPVKSFTRAESDEVRKIYENHDIPSVREPRARSGPSLPPHAKESVRSSADGPGYDAGDASRREGSLSMRGQPLGSDHREPLGSGHRQPLGSGHRQPLGSGHREPLGSGRYDAMFEGHRSRGPIVSQRPSLAPRLTAMHGAARVLTIIGWVLLAPAVMLAGWAQPKSSFLFFDKMAGKTPRQYWDMAMVDTAMFFVGGAWLLAIVATVLFYADDTKPSPGRMKGKPGPMLSLVGVATFHVILYLLVRLG